MKIKTLIICAFIHVIIASSFAQTGPGGVGNSTTNIAWFDASSNVFSDAGTTNATNNSSVQQWTDISGNNRTITQASASNKPTYKTNLINGFAGISFDGINDFIEGSLGGSTLTQTSVFWIGNFTNASQPNSDYDYVYSIGSAYNTNVSFARLAQNHTGGNGNKYYGYIMNQVLIGTSTLLNNSNHVYTQRINNVSTFHNMSVDGASQTVQQPASSASFAAFIRMGALKNSSPSHPFNGNISELIVYNSFLNTTQSIIIENYLSAKYALALSANDKYSFDATHGNEVAGIGQTSATDKHTASQGTSILLIESPSELEDGEFAMWGHDNAGFGTNGNDFSADTIQLDQEWRYDETGGDVGTINITFDLTGNLLGASPDQYILISDSDGDFSSGYSVLDETPIWNGNSVTFTANIADGDIFTVAYVGIEEDCNIFYVFDWSDAGEWSCEIEPDSTVNATLIAAEITVSGYTTVNDLTLFESTLTINANQTLKVFGDITLDGSSSIVGNTGSTLILESSFGAQTIITAGDTISVFNLTIENSDGVTLSDGVISLDNVLDLNSGTLDIDGNFVFRSTNSRTAHIENVGGNITGNCTVERFVQDRSPAWMDIGSPVVGTLISDIDNELKISGVIGADGYAASNSGGAFISLWTFDNTGGGYQAVENVTDAMTNGIGFEIWLADSMDLWIPKAWDMSGTIDLEDVAQQTLTIETGSSGWNFIANPYPAFLNFGSILENASNISDERFWVVDDENNYVFKTALNFIPPGQGFWVHVTNGNDIVIDPTSDFLTNTSTSATFKTDYIPDQELRILIKNESSDRVYGSNVYLKKNDFAFTGNDSRDIPLLKRPDPKGCYIAFEAEGVKNMVNYVNTNVEHLEIPLIMESGSTGNFSMSFDGLAQFNEYQCLNLRNDETGEVHSLNESSIVDFKLKENTPVNMTLVLSKEDFEDCLAPKMYTSGDVAISSYGKVIFTDFKLDRGTTAHISVLDILGNSVLTVDKNVGFNRELFDLSNATAGVYLVSITINGETQTEKVILQ